jgi:hypothetical protein
LYAKKESGRKEEGGQIRRERIKRSEGQVKKKGWMKAYKQGGKE